ncbi:MAG: 2-C-methyl-D-erythritol 2,4-cyclodiphosphate synthase [Gammaproteobacteria bacterium]|nr:2-C-methyl-D-erythritol 2,4-cyclodiphosphate synthase [Gammaproteobacteria bacterium]
MRIGHGYDVHRLVKGRKLILGGVEIEHTSGLLGHSDADVVLHAVCDAILGALGLGDIGQHFPDTDQRFAGAASRQLLLEVCALMSNSGFVVGNLDVTIVAQAPRLAIHLALMQKNIAADLQCPLARVNLKATTTEKLGFVGRQEGIESHAVIILKENNNE